MFNIEEADKQFKCMNMWAEKYGYYIVYMKYKGIIPDRFLRTLPFYYIGGGEPDIEEDDVYWEHCVVCYGDKIVFDPEKKGAGIKGLTGLYLIIEKAPNIKTKKEKNR